jgi:ribose 5-phosphate isomerase B
MHVYIASDHAGFKLKNILVSFLGEEGYHVHDCGPASFNVEDDYPDYILPMARRVAEDEQSVGIGIGASGQGEAMAANRVQGVRAAVYYGEARGEQTDAAGTILNLLQSTRAHNNANVLCIGARFISEQDAKHAVQLWLSTPFSGEARHARRIAKIDA